jgi:two-component system, OmpR family, response regulator CpxR
MLPDAFGLDVLREIRATDGSNGRFDPGLPVVVLSGRGAPADRVPGLAEGADDYVVKATRCSYAVAPRAPPISPARRSSIRLA